MSADDVTAENPAVEADDDHHDTRGVFILMLIFLGLIAAMWIWMYITLIIQGN